MFQHAVDAILGSVKRKHAKVYIVAINIFSKTEKKNLKHLDEVLRLLKDAGMTIKLKKCFFTARV